CPPAGAEMDLSRGRVIQGMEQAGGAAADGDCRQGGRVFEHPFFRAGGVGPQIRIANRRRRSMPGDQYAGRGAGSNVPKSIRAAGARTVRKLDFVLAQARSALDQLHERSAVKKRAVAGLGTFPPKRSLDNIFQTALNHPRGSIEMARRYSRSASKD